MVNRKPNRADYNVADPNVADAAATSRRTGFHCLKFCLADNMSRIGWPDRGKLTGQLSAILWIIAFTLAYAAPVTARRTDTAPPTVSYLPRTPQELLSELQKHKHETQWQVTYFKRVIEQGPAALRLLLDSLYPESKPFPSPIDTALRDLRSNDYKKVRKALTVLYEQGSPVVPLLKTLLNDPDPVVRIWIRGLFTELGGEQRFIYEGSYEFQYTPALGVALSEVKDPAASSEFVQRVIAALKRGSLDNTNNQALLPVLIRAVVKGKNDRYNNMLIPLLKEKDSRIAVFLTEKVGSSRDSDYFPPLLLQALTDKRPAVVEAAMNYTPHCNDEERCGRVHTLLRQIFKGNNESLKFQACFPLMFDYRDPEAVAYLLTQTQSKDQERATFALGWLGDSCNFRNPVYPELLEQVVPLLQAKDGVIRRAAADALGTYSGEDVVRNLIPMLGDKESIIVQETSRNLLDQPDKEMLRRYLAGAAHNHINEQVRVKAQELLNKLTETQKG